MARPRRVLPGRTYLLTRRCLERRFFLKPSPEVDRIFRYCLALAALRFGVRLHTAVAMSNHHHIVLTDVRGNLPRFCHIFHSLVARLLNAHYGRSENFWGPASYSAVLLAEPEDVLDKMAYVLANPVAAGLVERGTEWPGFITTPKMLLGRPGQAKVIQRPEGFFGENTALPELVELKFCCPEMLEQTMGKERAAEKLQELREEKEAAARERVKKAGGSFLGRKGVLDQHFDDSPSTREPRFRLSPTLACKDKWKRIELLQESAKWRSEYEDCRRRFKAGEREVEFPAGTWGPVVLYGARVKPPPEPAPPPPTSPTSPTSPPPRDPTADPPPDHPPPLAA